MWCTEGKFFEKETTTDNREKFFHQRGRQKRRKKTQKMHDEFLKGQKTTRAMKMKRE